MTLCWHGLGGGSQALWRLVPALRQLVQAPRHVLVQVQLLVLGLLQVLVLSLLQVLVLELKLVVVLVLVRELVLMSALVQVRVQVLVQVLQLLPFLPCRDLPKPGTQHQHARAGRRCSHCCHAVVLAAAADIASWVERPAAAAAATTTLPLAPPPPPPCPCPSQLSAAAALRKRCWYVGALVSWDRSASTLLLRHAWPPA